MSPAGHIAAPAPTVASETAPPRPATGVEFRPSAAGAAAAVRRVAADSGCRKHSFGGVTVHPADACVLQRKLTVSQPGDKYEREADEVAERVMRMSDPAVVEDELQRLPDGSPALQRQPDESVNELVVDLEGAVPQAAEADVTESEWEDAQGVDAGVTESDGDAPQTEEEEDAEEMVQAKSVPGHSSELDPEAQSLVDRSRGGGHSLPAAARTFFEPRFGHDFGRVRVHTDDRAAEAARAVHARAFTVGRDIVFARGQFSPDSPAGRKLLAHELTHVVQQRGAELRRKCAACEDEEESSPPAVEEMGEGVMPQLDPSGGWQAISATSDPMLQRDGNDGNSTERRYFGQIFMFDAKSEKIYSNTIMSTATGAALGPGVYSVRMTGGGSKYWLHLYDSRRLVRSMDLIPGSPELFGKAAGQAKSVFVAVGDTKSGLLSPQPGGQGAGPQPGNGGENGSKDGEDGEGDSGAAGSKYGWLGLLNLPPEVITILEGIIEVLGESEELLALRDLLQTLSELKDHRGEIESWFTDTDKLLAVALGLEDSPAIDLIEKWVAKPATKRKLVTKDKDRKGIIAFAQKVMRVLEKIRRALKPVFNARSVFFGVLGAAGTLLEKMPLLEEVLGLKQNGGGESEVAAYVDKIADEAASAIHRQLKDARAAFQLVAEKFLADDLIKDEDVARVVTQAVVMAVPKQYKPVVQIAQELGLQQLISDNLVAPMIPKDALDGINGMLHNLTDSLQPTIKAAEEQLDKTLSEIEGPLQDELIPGLKDLVLQPSAGSGGLRPDVPAVGFARALAASRGESLSEDVRREMETSIGFDFSRVRIHRDAAAGRANEMVGANAFVRHQDVYFGAGNYEPHAPEGRWLLAHELAHVVQQRQGFETGVIQRDYESFKKRMAKIYGTRALDGLKTATAKSPAKEAKAEEVRDRIEKLKGRQVVSKTNPGLPEAYYYVESGGKIKGIRRRIAWLRYVPSLTIDKNGRIQPGFFRELDPKNLARAQLRLALGCQKSKEQAHHLIPLELRGHPAAKLAEANGWVFNGSENGICLSLATHSGSHPIYTDKARKKLNALVPAGGAAPVWDQKFQTKFFQVVAELRQYCQTLNTKKIKLS